MRVRTCKSPHSDARRRLGASAIGAALADEVIPKVAALVALLRVRRKVSGRHLADRDAGMPFEMRRVTEVLIRIVCDLDSVAVPVVSPANIGADFAENRGELA